MEAAVPAALLPVVPIPIPVPVSAPLSPTGTIPLSTSSTCSKTGSTASTTTTTTTTSYSNGRPVIITTTTTITSPSSHKSLDSADLDPHYLRHSSSLLRHVAQHEEAQRHQKLGQGLQPAPATSTPQQRKNPSAFESALMDDQNALNGDIIINNTNNNGMPDDLPPCGSSPDVESTTEYVVTAHPRAIKPEASSSQPDLSSSSSITPQNSGSVSPPTPLSSSACACRSLSPSAASSSTGSSHCSTCSLPLSESGQQMVDWTSPSSEGNALVLAGLPQMENILHKHFPSSSPTLRGVVKRRKSRRNGGLGPEKPSLMTVNFLLQIPYHPPIPQTPKAVLDFLRVVIDSASDIMGIILDEDGIPIHINETCATQLALSREQAGKHNWFATWVAEAEREYVWKQWPMIVSGARDGTTTTFSNRIDTPKGPILVHWSHANVVNPDGSFLFNFAFGSWASEDVDSRVKEAKEEAEQYFNFSSIP
ncbi:hypothetical protein Pelo_6257 [Pelomyxa schiedti]|nr:hypothetical protein Pelo_6257 [Pelomyxa schiedti]